MGSGAGSFLQVVLNNFDILAGPVVSLLYPLYASVRSIEDDQQRLTYWVLYSMMTLCELTFAKVIEWIPIWSYSKTINIWYVPRMKDIFSRKEPDDIITAAEKYIQQNGPEEFEKLISKSDKSRRRNGYDEDYRY